MDLQEYNEFAQAMTSNDYKVQGTVTLSLGEVDKLRGAVLQRDKLIANLKETQKKVKITLRQKTVKSKMHHPMGRSSYEENYEEWEEVNSYKNLDDIMDGLKATIKEEVTKNYSNRLENSEKKVDTLSKKLTDLQIEYNTCSEKLSVVWDELKEEKSKKASIEQNYVMVVSEKEVLERNLEMSRNREIKLRKLLDSETFLSKLSKFFGVN